ncbi:recombinase family protein [Brucella oryzae]|nr:recombinase family protein [Brucella oryzae]MBR7651511.1 recombinase family protein [Brucella oryzae]
MQFLGIEIIGIHEGTASTVTVGLRSIVSQLFREDNARKVRRGMEGLVKSGLSAGGQAYGFKADPANKGKLIPVPEEIAIVQRIFRKFAEGKSPRHIATDLQAEGIRPPRGAAWAPSAIYGWADRGAERFISSLADIHASPSASRGSGLAKTIRATSGRTSSASLPNSTRNGVSSRTSKGICPWVPIQSSGTFADWALASKRACSARSKSGPAISGVGSSLWPTPTKSLYCNKAEIELVSDSLRFRPDPTQAGSQLALGKIARLWTHIWLLMKACGGTPTKPFSFPSSHPLHISLNAGPRSSVNDLTFNPNFSDWVMGWPIGWTDPMQRVTGWSVWLQHMRGALLKLPIAEIGFDG